MREKTTTPSEHRGAAGSGGYQPMGGQARFPLAGEAACPLNGACASLSRGWVAVAAGSGSPGPRRHGAVRPPASVRRQRPRLWRCRSRTSSFIPLGFQLESTEIHSARVLTEPGRGVFHTAKSQVRKGDIVYSAQGARQKFSTYRAHRFSKLYNKYALQQTNHSSLATSYLVLLLMVRGDLLLAHQAFREGRRMQVKPQMRPGGAELATTLRNVM